MNELEEIKKALSTSIFNGLDRTKLLEVFDGCKVRSFKSGQYVFRQGEFGKKCGIIISGTVRVQTTNKISKANLKDYSLSPGEFVGAISLLTGSKRIADVIAFRHPIKILFMSKLVMMRLIDIFPSLEEKIKESYKTRVKYFCIRNLDLFSALNDVSFEKLISNATIYEFNKNEPIFMQGDNADGLYIIRFGVVKITEKNENGKENILAILKQGQYFGEMALLFDDGKRSATAYSCCRTEIVKISVDDFNRVLSSYPNIKKDVENVIKQRKDRYTQLRGDNYLQDVLKTVIDAGIVQSSSIILIDTTKCVHCGDCEKACAALHEDNSRLIRKGFKLNNFLLIPTSCRLCNDPVCLEKCPTNSIFRAFTGEIYLKDSCIGCGTCAENCPYDNITISDVRGDKSNIKEKQSCGMRAGGRDHENNNKNMGARKRAVTCDMCKDYPSYACVYNCSTGAVRRVDPSEYFDEIRTIG